MARIFAAIALLSIAACGGDKETSSNETVKSQVGEAASNVSDEVKTPEKTAPVERRTLLAVGVPAPDFSMKAHDGKTITLSQLKGEAVVVYFYPRDETPG